MTVLEDELIAAVKRGDFETVKRLVEEEFVDPVVAQNELAQCVEKGELNLVDFLICYGCTPTTAALAAALKASKFGTLEYLLWRGADATTGNAGPSIFFRAIDEGKLAAVEIIVEAGVDIDAPGIQGSTRTPLLEAMGCGDVKIAKYLIEQGANLEARDENDDTPLTYAAQAGELSMVELLLEHGADVTAKGFNDGTALFQAIVNGHYEVATYLAQHGADVNARNKVQATPLMEAVMRGNIDVVKALVDKGADVHATTALGWTPLIQAAARGHLEIARLLIARGADVNARDAFGRNAADWADGEHHSDVKELLTACA